MLENKHTFMEQLHKKKSLLWILILTITLLWGYAWTVMKMVLQYMGPFTFTSIRFAIGTIVLLLIIFVMKIGIPPKRYWKHLLVIGILQTAIVYLLIMFGLELVGAGKSSVLTYTMPIWSSILATKFLGEKLTTPKIIGLSAGFIGLLTILGWDIWVGQSFAVILGELLIVVASISWAISNIYYRKFANDLPEIQVAGFSMLCGAIAIFLVALIVEWGQPIEFNWISVYAILFSGVLASALCFTLWFTIMNMIDMATATISTLLVPIFGLILSSILLGEKMTASIIIGSVLIIGGIAIAQKKTPLPK